VLAAGGEPSEALRGHGIGTSGGTGHRPGSVEPSTRVAGGSAARPRWGSGGAGGVTEPETGHAPCFPGSFPSPSIDGAGNGNGKPSHQEP
jgi:hypothetical protein